MLLVVAIDGAVNVATFVLVLEATVDDHDVLKIVIVFAIHEFQKNALIDARQCVSLILRYEMRKL